MPTKTPWQPILQGAAAARAGEVIEAIAADLRRLPPHQEAAGAAASAPFSPSFSLAGGDAGEALFFAYLNLVRPGGDWEDVAVERLERAIETAGQLQTFPGLYVGFTGVAWVLEHFQQPIFDDPAAAGETDEAKTAADADEDDPGLEIAAALAAYLTHSRKPEDYDLISGLTGLGVYALERLPRRFGRECLDRLAERLQELVEERPEGLSWRTPPELIMERDRPTYPSGYFNLGVAHGVPGVIGLLGGMCAAGVAAAPARRLLDGAVAWLLAQKLGPDAASCFAYNVGPGSTLAPTRLAWCYGDLGIAATLFATAEAVGAAEWREEALKIGLAAAARAAQPPEVTGTKDYGLCHGAAGIGHLFNRLYQGSGDPRFREAAQVWFERALAAAKPGTGIGGYLALLSGENEQLEWRPDPGFLTGVAGIGLALLAAISPVEPAWDRVLLASLPTPPAS